MKPDTRYWVHATSLDGKTTRHPFVERRNAEQFQLDCLAAGMIVTLVAPRNPERPWETLPVDERGQEVQP